MALGRLKPSNRMIIGVGVLLFAAVLIGYGLHHLIRTGTCSSTGYSANYGPVPHCPAGTGAWVGFLVGGIFLVMIGAAISGSLGLILPGIFCAIGAGAFSVALDKSASSGAGTFGLIFGGCFLVGGAIPVLFVLSGSLRAAVSPQPFRPLAPPRPPAPTHPANQPQPTGAEDAFGRTREEPDAILDAYRAARQPGGDPPVPPATYE